MERSDIRNAQRATKVDRVFFFVDRVGISRTRRVKRQTGNRIIGWDNRPTYNLNKQNDKFLTQKYIYVIAD